MSDGFRRGTTPTNVFNVNVDMTGATVFVTYSQYGKVVVEKTGEDLTVAADSVTVVLSQADTVKFQAGNVSIQIRYVTAGGFADASNVIMVNVGQILKDGVITYAV